MNDKRILIVGHGLAGATLAYQLYKQQIQFTVVENPQYNAASRVAAGMINPIVFRRLNKSWMLDECLPIMHHFYKEIEHDLNLSFYHNMDIHKLLSEEEKQFWDQKLSKNEDLHRYLLKSVLSELKSNQVKEYPATGIVKQGGYCDLNILLNGLKNK